MEKEKLTNKSVQTVNGKPILLSDSNLLIEIEVSESFCSRLLNENLPEDSLVEVTVIKPDRMNQAPSTSGTITEQERRKREAQYHIDSKMNELIAKMKDLSKDPKTYKPTGQILHKTIRQQFLSTLGLQTLTEPQVTEKPNSCKDCSTQTSYYQEINMKKTAPKFPFKTKRDKTKYLSSAEGTQRSTDWDCSSSVVSNTSISQTFRNVREPIFTRESIQKNIPLGPVQFENNVVSETPKDDNIMKSLPIKLCSSKSQEFLKHYIKQIDEKINTEDNKIVKISKPPSKKPNLLKRLSFIKIKKNSIIFKKKNSKKEKLKEETTNDSDQKEKGDLFQCLNHLPETTISQYNMNSLRKIEMSDESLVPKKDSVLKMILTLENQLVSIIEKDDLVWELGRSQECYRARESDSKETNQSLYKLSTNLKNDQISVENQSIAKIKDHSVQDKESVTKSNHSSCISKSDRVLGSTSDWQTIEEEMSSHKETKGFSKETEPIGDHKDRVYVQQRVDLPGPWHPFCQGSYNDTSTLLRDPNRERNQRRGSSGGWARPWSAPTPASKHLPTGSVWFWDGTKLRPAYDLRDRVEGILLGELDQTESRQSFTRIPIPRDPNEQFPRFVNNDYLSRMVELKQALERPHLPPPMPLESVLPTLKKRSSSRASSLLSTFTHLRNVKLQQDPPKRKVEPERHICEQEYVALTAPPFQTSKKPSTKSLHVTYLNPLLTNTSQEQKSSHSRPRKHHRDSPQEESSIRKTKRPANRKRFRNTRDSDLGVFRRSNIQNHHLYELMRCAQKRQVRKLSDDPEDFEIELELTSKDLCRVLGMNTVDPKDFTKRKGSSPVKSKASPRKNLSRGPSPASESFKGTMKDHHRKETNQERVKLKVQKKERDKSPKEIRTSPERRSQKRSQGQLRSSQRSRSPTNEIRTSCRHQVRFGHTRRNTSHSSRDHQASNIS